MKKLTFAMLAALAAGIFILPIGTGGGNGTAVQRARAERAALLTDEPTTSTTAVPAPVPPVATPETIETSATTGAEAPAVVVPVPVPVPANIAGGAGKDNAPIIPGHWVQATNGAIYRDASPDTAPQVGTDDPGYEDGLDVELCADKPWICGD